MSQVRHDVIGIGNALVDVLVQIDDEALGKIGLVKGSMTLVDTDESDRLYAQLPEGVTRSGGSCGNTMVGLAALGGRGAYIGRVKDDQFGKAFLHDMGSRAVHCPNDKQQSGPGTGRCLVMVTPDAQRTMATCLGAASELTPNDLSKEDIAAASVLYMEGYLFDRDEAKAAFIAAAEVSHAAGQEVSLSLSDSFCVDRHRAAFKQLVKGHIDILFANEQEITALYEVATFDEALNAVQQDCKLACLTRGENGSVVVSPEGVHEIPAEPVSNVVDTTGAGDQYAAGFLAGYTQGRSLADSGRMGSIMAGEIIGHFGAHPEADVAALVKDALGR